MFYATGRYRTSINIARRARPDAPHAPHETVRLRAVALRKVALPAYTPTRCRLSELPGYEKGRDAL